MRSQLKLGFLLILIALITGVPNALPAAVTISDSRMLALVNQDRAQHGLPQLEINPKLSSAAFAKAQDMARLNYFNHISPSGITPWNFFKMSGYNYSYAGENLAINFTDANDLERSWMNSPDHRANILSPNYSDLGLAVLDTGNKTIIVQFFGSKDNKLSLNR